MIYVECNNCDCKGDVDLPAADGMIGMLACPNCGAPVDVVDVTPFRDWIDRRVAAKAEMQRTGRIGTRKQSTKLSDREIDRDGTAAELAACLLFCPGNRNTYLHAPSGSNRGADLTPGMTGLARPLEVKQTRYRSDTKGFLIVRPPVNTPGRMLMAYLDESIYVLLHGEGWVYQLMGWTDRDGLIRDGTLNPTGSAGREHWGIHWSKLRPIIELARMAMA